jgi:hypothetical protein
VEDFRGHLHDYFARMPSLERDYAMLAELNGERLLRWWLGIPTRAKSTEILDQERCQLQS